MKVLETYNTSELALKIMNSTNFPKSIVSRNVRWIHYFLLWGLECALNLYRFYWPDNRFYFEIYLTRNVYRVGVTDFVSPFGNYYLTIGLFDKQGKSKSHKLVRDFEIHKTLRKKIELKLNTDKNLYDGWLKLHKSGKSYRGIIRTNEYFDAVPRRLSSAKVD